MKQRIAYLAAPLALIAMACALYLSFVSPAAQADNETSKAFPARQLEGSWRFTSTAEIDGETLTLRGLYTFARGGVMLSTDELTFQPGYASTTGLGTWERTGRNEYAFTMELLFFRQSDFNFEARVRVFGKIKLTGEDTFTDVSQSDTLDAEGNFIGTICATEEATRVEIEPYTSCVTTPMSQMDPATTSKASPTTMSQTRMFGRAGLLKRLKT